MTADEIKDQLKQVKYPGFSRDIVSFGLIKSATFTDGTVHVELQITTSDPKIPLQIRSEVDQCLRAHPLIQRTIIDVAVQPVRGPVTGGNLAGTSGAPKAIKYAVAIASGKGGVGKSTFAVNLACALAQVLSAAGRPNQVGILDCDIYGPSIPLMMGIHDKPSVSSGGQLVPPLAHGVKVMSIGLLLEDDQPVIWRGPMITKTIQQFLMSVEWTDLDFLLIDLPPGTGDAQLSLCQTVPLDGGVIITTPQEASLGVVRKGIAMFTKVNVPILGLVENMSYFTTPTGDRVEIFGHGGGRTEAGRQKAPFLGEVPIFTAIREGGDAGTPIMVSAPNHLASQAFLQIARKLV